MAREHYLQVTEEHFERAAGILVRNEEDVQNAAQQSHAQPCATSHTVGESAKCDGKQDLATLRERQVGPVGFEPTTKGL